MKVALFDYGAGNLHSLQKALEAGGASVVVTRNWSDALSLDALVLPGVGSFGAAVRSLEDHADEVQQALEEGLPCLGICLGMQLFYETSEEGGGQGNGLFQGSVRKLKTRVVPQMGWNDVSVTEDPLFQGVTGLIAYYANSYVCQEPKPEEIIATTEYQGDVFPAGIRKGRTWGVQFHPEKSSAPGLRIIENFLKEAGS